ncbi:MAG TPA: J domain-containing protein [bacterium]|nr:J domain-containing protein [bacterium]
MTRPKDNVEKSLALLGVKEGATQAELKQAFRRKAVALHPDVNPGDPMAAEAFKRVTAAYELLRSRARAESAAAKKKKSIEEAVPGAAAPKAAHRPRPRSVFLPLDELVIRMRLSKNPYVRLHAVRAISALGGKEVAWALIKALSDEERAVRAEAVAAIAELESRVAVIPLISLHKTSDAAMRAQIESALARVDSPMAAAFLERAGKRPPPRSARMPASGGAV